jgi:hypothetical protein
VKTGEDGCEGDVGEVERPPPHDTREKIRVTNNNENTESRRPIKLLPDHNNCALHLPDDFSGGLRESYALARLLVDFDSLNTKFMSLWQKKNYPGFSLHQRQGQLGD